MKPRIRCAIYTRKSSDEGLDQSFNSLDAQREACEAFVQSQRHEGWVLLKALYDDGGISGGTLARPALERLLADIDAGLVDQVVVYKIDRLTRSLADFAELVDRFDAAACSFVSVTQAFNTATSMGRLTLNVLLSFAQFEREVTAERIRDKIAASKKKGLWMGGLPPLGYDLDPDPNVRGLNINDHEAETVRRLFQLYAAERCLRTVHAQAIDQKIVSKRRVFASGRSSGGYPLSRGQIHYLLTNPIYIGLIHHKGKTHPGQHAPVVDSELWDRVQAALMENAGRSRSTSRNLTAQRSDSSGLVGRLFDDTGDRLTPTHTNRHGKRYRYYVSSRLIRGEQTADPIGWRFPAKSFEAVLAKLIRTHLRTHVDQHRLLAVPDVVIDPRIRDAAAKMEGALENERLAVLSEILVRVEIRPDVIWFSLSAEFLASIFAIDAAAFDQGVLEAEYPIKIRRRGIEARIIEGELEPRPDRTLIRALSKASHWAAAIRSGAPIGKVAVTAGVTPAYVRSRLPLAFLAPAIQNDIVSGRFPGDISLERLLRVKIPMNWAEQHQMLKTLADPA